MITRRHLVTTALLATVALASSCTKEPQPEPTVLPTPSRGGPRADAPDPAEEDLEPEFSPTPTDAASGAAAGDHAIATLEALWATSKPQAQWYEDLATLMTPGGGEPFEYTLVENVVPSTVTGDPNVEFLDEGNTAEVTVPSGQGDWVLTLYRDGAGWLTESIRFPEGQG